MIGALHAPFKDKQMEQVASQTRESVEPRRYLEPPPSHRTLGMMKCQQRLHASAEKERHELSTPLSILGAFECRRGNA